MPPPKNDALPYKGNDPASVSNVSRYLYDNYVISWDDADALANENSEQVETDADDGLSARASAEKIATTADLIAVGLEDEELEGDDNWLDEEGDEELDEDEDDD